MADVMKPAIPAISSGGAFSHHRFAHSRKINHFPQPVSERGRSSTVPREQQINHVLSARLPSYMKPTVSNSRKGSQEKQKPAPLTHESHLQRPLSSPSYPQHRLPTQIPGPTTKTKAKSFRHRDGSPVQSALRATSPLRHLSPLRGQTPSDPRKHTPSQGSHSNSTKHEQSDQLSSRQTRAISAPNTSTTTTHTSPKRPPRNPSPARSARNPSPARSSLNHSPVRSSRNVSPAWSARNNSPIRAPITPNPRSSRDDNRSRSSSSPARSSARTHPRTQLLAKGEPTPQQSAATSDAQVQLTDTTTSSTGNEEKETEKESDIGKVSSEVPASTSPEINKIQVDVDHSSPKQAFLQSHSESSSHLLSSPSTFQRFLTSPSPRAEALRARLQLKQQEMELKLGLMEKDMSSLHQGMLSLSKRNEEPGVGDPGVGEPEAVVRERSVDSELKSDGESISSRSEGSAKTTPTTPFSKPALPPLRKPLGFVVPKLSLAKAQEIIREETAEGAAEIDYVKTAQSIVLTLTAADRHMYE